MSIISYVLHFSKGFRSKNLTYLILRFATFSFWSFVMYTNESIFNYKHLMSGLRRKCMPLKYSSVWHARIRKINFLTVPIFDMWKWSTSSSGIGHRSVRYRASSFFFFFLCGIESTEFFAVSGSKPTPVYTEHITTNFKRLFHSTNCLLQLYWNTMKFVCFAYK